MTPNKRESDFAGFHSFKDENGKDYGSFEVFWGDPDDIALGGWYWWKRWEDHEPEGTGEAYGPFSTSLLAYADALSSG